MSDDDSDRNAVPLSEAQVRAILRRETGAQPEELPEWVEIEGKLYKRITRFSPEHQEMMGVHEVFDQKAEDVEPSADGRGLDEGG